MADCTVAIAKEEKAAAEAAILQILQEFSRKTGLTARRVDIDLLMDFGRDFAGNYVVQYQVDLEATL
jgi:hypothetical protein